MITMSELSPWASIPVPSCDFNVLKVSGHVPVDCYWGKDIQGHCLFIMELDGDHTDQFRKGLVRLKGLSLDLRARGTEGQMFVLTLDRSSDRDLFAGLCRTLILALVQATDSTSALAVSLIHIQRWKAFLSGKSQGLTPERVRGLFGELLFLRELIEQGIANATAIDAWIGPERAQHDFSYRNIAVEIKSISGQGRGYVRISSEDQLESLKDRLFLRVYRLSDLSESSGGRSLNDLVGEIRDLLVDADALDAFYGKLAGYGYAPIPEYDTPCFVVSEERSYRVSKDFPRIIRSELMAGIDNVSYDVRLEALVSYGCEAAALHGDQ